METHETRTGRSNLRRFGGMTAPTGLEFRPVNSSQGVVLKTNLFNVFLTNSVTSYRGPRDGSSTAELTPGSIIRANIEVNSKPKFDLGHPFFARKEELFVSHPHVTLHSDRGAFYQGPIIPAAVYNDVGAKWCGSDLKSIRFEPVNMAMGTTAIARCEPTRNSFSLVRALTEVVRDFPALPFKALSDSKSWSEVVRNLGSEHLNLAFGIVPTVKDLITLCQTVISYGDKLAQFERDLGKPVRRSYYYPDVAPKVTSLSGKFDGDRVSTEVLGPAAQEYWDSSRSFNNNQTETFTEKYWFAGAFEYYLDPLLASLGPAGEFYAKANQILGLNLSLSTIWELSPWSWLVDWFFNVRDFISVNEKLSSDSLVLRYGYLMRTSTLEMTTEMSGLTPLGSGIPTSVSATFRVIEKQRVRATPYGFGITAAEFSIQQWAILGALGLTKAPKTLF